MRNWLFTLILLTTAVSGMAQIKSNRETIYAIMDRQASDWNKGDIAAFMNGYWESDSLMFVGKSGVTYGYKATYEGYLKRYPDRAAMGTLKFTYINFTEPQPDVAFLVGKFHLTRPEKGDLEGYYTILWKKINGKWVIICDHTS
ncbi:YybH family protein [Dyadobacter sediminis]|uniref:Nuclear transport factor 2 family protein n=1 Tax=Dyadobacter sediminis TaxID=1493691 RepID=A0A5R9K5W6_9BACT|nr:nuclear transport factor 2 family protein [Dyadobacter sediminis]TLU89055.1 nuclear transport factor 2 family protein [Dyadobacter sediminis]